FVVVNVPLQEEQQKPLPQAQDPGRADAVAAADRAALVPRPAVRLCRRHRLRQPRPGGLRRPPEGSPDAGEPLLRRRQPVRGAPRGGGQETGAPAAQEGARLPSPQEGVALYTTQLALVRWYGGGWRQVAYVSGVGHWYRAGADLVAVRWVYVHDLSGTHRDDYLYSTDPSLTPEQIIEEYTGRWNIETMFAEMRAYLGLETTRGWCRQTVLRAAPSLFGLYGLVALWYEHLAG